MITTHRRWLNDWEARWLAAPDPARLHRWQAEWTELRHRYDRLTITLRETDLPKGQRALLEAAQRRIGKELAGRDIAPFHRRGGRSQRLPLI